MRWAPALLAVVVISGEPDRTPASEPLVTPEPKPAARSADVEPAGPDKPAEVAEEAAPPSAAAAAPAAASPAAVAAIPREQVDFFETKIRPLLVNRCLDCHADDANGGLQLDSAAAVMKGGISGPALVPGKPAESRIIKAVRGEKGVKAMPPDDPLSEEEIADLATWIETGAADPRTGQGSLSPIERLFDQARDHWSFQPIANPPVPSVKRTDLVRTPIDAFIQAALESKGWSMSARADGRTLLRRASLDLIGLPPDATAADSLAANSSPAVFESAVESLLASPAYGERWGRHWLDVARYADSKGRIGSGGSDAALPFAFTYRDWVVQALNDDMPYDRFIVEQLTADIIGVTPDDNRRLAALGFLTVGRRPFGDNEPDVMDDRIDVIARGLLGLSVSCARCHDHKLEPIKTVDYYGLYGVMMSCADVAEPPLMVPQPPSQEIEAFREENRRVRERYIRVMAFEAERGIVAQRVRLGDYLLAAHDGRWKLPDEDDKKVQKEILQPRRLAPGVYTAVVKAKETWIEANPSIFLPWLEFSALPPEEFAAKALAMAEAYAVNADRRIAGVMASAFAKDEKPTSLEAVAEIYNKQARQLESLWGERFRGQLDQLCVMRPDEENIPAGELVKRAIGRVHEATIAAAIPFDQTESDLMNVLTLDTSPFVFLDESKTPLFTSRDVAGGLRRNANGMLAKVGNHPGAPVRLMPLKEDKPFDAKVFVRGNPGTPGEPAPRQYLSILRGPDSPPFPQDSSGRKELAALIASPQNPLTARVIVNRVWAWHFGQGLVRTASDFGLQGERPSHPELLDWLATRFIADGWSLKALHRLIMQSHVYQQAGPVATAPAGPGSSSALDPENRMLWRFPSRPLEFEVIRDSMLAVGGGLDMTIGGRPFNIDEDDARRRTLYARIDRKQGAAVLRNFNLPDSNFSAAGRVRTAVPTQGLWLFNSPTAIGAAKRLAAKAQEVGGPSPAIIHALWRAALQRNPSPQELADAEEFLAGYPDNDIIQPQADDWSYGFSDYDPATKAVKGFTPIGNFAGSLVRGEKVDGFDGTAMELTPDGGKAAPGKAVVRRWTAPEQGTVMIDAELVHVVTAAPGGSSVAEAPAAAAQAPPTADSAPAPIVCRIIHSRHGQLGEWKAASEGVMTQVERVACEPGDTIDFVALTDLDPAKSGFIWSPAITMFDREMREIPGMRMRWDARHDFIDPKSLPKPLGPYEELAQVLLVSSEFAVMP